MKKTENKIQSAFIKLLSSTKIDDIDVQLICKKLNITRQTFYYHYQNIYDLIFSIFINNRIKNSKQDDLNSIYGNVVEYLFEDEDFNKKIAESSASSVLNDFCSSFVNISLLNYLNKYGLNNESKKTFSRFLSKGITEEILYRFEQGNSKEDILRSIKLLVNENDVSYLTNSLKTKSL